MRKIAILGIAALFAAPVLAGEFSAALPYSSHGSGGGVAVDDYQWDDGTTENSVGLTAGGDLAWIHGFTSVAGLETITHVNTAIGSAAFPNNGALLGSTIDVYVWSDPNANPTDGGSVLLGQGSGTVTQVDNDVLQSIALNAPVNVSGGFLIGASIVHPAGLFPDPLDQSQNSNGRAFVAGDTGGNFDPNNIGGGIGVFDMDSIGLNGVHLLRANAIPEPATLSLLALGGLALLRRRR